jgi:hypothetical protein
MKQFVESKDLKTNEWIKLGKVQKQKPISSYDALLDNFYIYFVPFAKNERILTFYIDRYAAFLIRAKDNEIVGMCFEAVQKSFFPAHINKRWRLSDTKITLEGIRDLHFGINVVEETKPAPHYIVRKPIDKNIELEPVYA